MYLRLAREVTDGGRRVLVLVPEIALTPVVAGLFRARFGRRVAIQHSGLSAGERHDQWHRIRAARSTSSSARGRPSSRRSIDSDSSSSTKSTRRPTSRTTRRGTTAGTWPSCADAWNAPWSCWDRDALARVGGNARRGRYETIRLRRRVLDRPLARCASSTCGGNSLGRARRPSAPRSPRGSRSPGPGRAVPCAPESARVCDGHLLPAVRGLDGMSALQRDPHLPPRGTPGAVPLLQLCGGRAEALRRVWR